jgi:hypothetical protein
MIVPITAIGTATMLQKRENNAQMKSAKVGQRFCSVVFGLNSNSTASLGASGAIVAKIALPAWMRDLEASVRSLIVYDTRVTVHV